MRSSLKERARVQREQRKMNLFKRDCLATPRKHDSLDAGSAGVAAINDRMMQRRL